MRRAGRKLLILGALLAVGVLAWRLWPQGHRPVPPAELAALAEKMESRYRVDRSLILAVVACESGGDAWAQSEAGAVGLMQLLPSTAQDLAARHSLDCNLRDPAGNMQLGTLYLRELGDRFDDQPDLVIAAYHAGPTRVAGWRRDFPRLSIAELIRQQAGPRTRAYVANVKASWAQFRAARKSPTVARAHSVSANIPN